MRNWIIELRADYKNHLVFGLIINPLIYLALFLFGGSILLSLILCVSIHFLIEVCQKVFNKGQFDLIDAFWGTSTAILIYLSVLIL